MFSLSLEIAYLYSSIFYVIFALLDIINISSTIVPGLLSLFAQDGFGLPVVLLNLVALCLAFKPLVISVFANSVSKLFHILSRLV